MAIETQAGNLVWTGTVTYSTPQSSWQAFVAPGYVYPVTGQAGPDPNWTADNRCPHCDRDYHPAPLTEKYAEMWDQNRWDDVGGVDASRVVCVGSDCYGPARPKGPQPYYNPYVAWPEAPYSYQELYHNAMAATIEKINEDLQAILGWPSPVEFKTWLPGDPGPPQELPCHEIDVSYGPENWTYEAVSLTGKEMSLASAFNEYLELANPFLPVPPKPGIDFSQYDTDIKYGPIKKGKKK